MGRLVGGCKSVQAVSLGTRFCVSCEHFELFGGRGVCASAVSPYVRPAPFFVPGGTRCALPARMATPPGYNKHGATYLVTKRTIFRKFLLKPSELAVLIVLYCLGYSLQKCPGIELHAYTVMSNHFHLLLTCLDGNKPDFCRGFHSLVARALNRSTNAPVRCSTREVRTTSSA